jgi:hypothetical protein
MQQRPKSLASRAALVTRNVTLPAVGSNSEFKISVCHWLRQCARRQRSHLYFEISVAISVFVDSCLRLIFFPYARFSPAPLAYRSIPINEFI